jgi:hypothetical protein
MKYITIERYLTEFPLAEQYDNDLITQFINNAESDFDGLCGANVINDFLNALNQFQDRTDADVTLFETAICKQTDFLLDKEHREGITQMNISNNGVNNSIKLNGVLYDSSAVKILEQLQIYIKSTQVYRMGSEQKPTTVDNDYATKK